MVDREKVIKGLEHCGQPTECDGCPYDSEMGGCFRYLKADALNLLKEQEPIEPKVDVDEWRCGNCGHELEHQELLGENVLFHEQYSYCPQCGKAVKWDA